MRSKTDFSYGVIPLIKKEGEWQVLVIHQYGSKGDVYWGFPKGHAEEGESGTDAAVRELREETSMELVRLDSTRTFTQRYTFKHGESTIKKTVTYYIGYAASREVKLEERELKNAKWCSFSDAQKLLTHDGTKRMFDEVVEYVGN